MSPSLKAFLALVFVAVMGAVLIRPIVNAVDTPLVAPSEDTPAPARSKRAKLSPTPRPTANPEPSPSNGGGLISDPFRTQPLFDRYPSRCLPVRGLTEAGTRVAVAGSDGVVVSGSDGSGRQAIGEKSVLGFSAGGGELAVRGRSAAVSVYDFLDGEPAVPLRDVDAWAYSPTSPCAVALRQGQLIAEPNGPGRGLLVTESVESFSLSPDGSRLAVVMEEIKTTSVWLADLDGTTLREVHRVRTGPAISLEAWSPNGRTLYLSSGPGSGLSFVTVHKASVPPLSGGVVATTVAGLEQCGDRLLGVVNGAIAVISTRGPDYLTRTNAGYTAVSCAPDGSFLAALRDDNLLLLDAQGRELRDLTLDTGFSDVYLDWGERGSGLLLGRVPAGGGFGQVWHIPEGGAARDTGLRFSPGPGAIDWSASPPTGIPLR